MTSPFPCCPVNREGHVKENPDRKQKEKTKGCDLRVKYFCGVYTVWIFLLRAIIFVNEIEYLLMNIRIKLA